MRTVTIKSPDSPEPYPSFTHQTTTYVGIEHGEPSELCVYSPGATIVSIQVNGHELRRSKTRGNACVKLSDLVQPRREGLIAGIEDLLSVFGTRRNAAAPRLYAFSVVLYKDTVEPELLATFEFHILCPFDYGLAQDMSSLLSDEPAAIAPDTIFDRVEGSCPECKHLRELLS